MSDTSSDSHRAATDQLLEEASLWFARMRGPDADSFRPDFEKWLNLGAAHRGAYERAGEVFAMGRFLAEEKASAHKARAMAASNWRPAPRHWALAAGLVVAIGVGTWVALPHLSGTSVSQEKSFAAADREGAIVRSSISTIGVTRRTVRLADGSIVTLGEGSLLNAAFTASARELRLERGQVRFDVAHEGRPFVVHAGGGSVTAKGTIFEVSLAGGNRVTVRLLRGAVDVARPRAQAGGASTVTRLSAGEVLSFGVGIAAQSTSPARPDIDAAAGERDLSTLYEFDRTPLREVLKAANRGSVTQILVRDSAVAELKVSGRFRVDDAEQVAERLTALFDLKANHIAEDQILLSAPRQE